MVVYNYNLNTEDTEAWVQGQPGRRSKASEKEKEGTEEGEEEGEKREKKKEIVVFIKQET